MPLLRVSSPGSKGLTEFYSDLANLPEPNYYRRVGEQMLELLPLLEEAFADTEVWWLTSHEILWLMDRNVREAPVYVTLRALGWDGFIVRYFLPDEEAPWPDAVLEGNARTPPEAVWMVQEAMRRSAGWGSSPGAHVQRESEEAGTGAG
jgi:hypothetical protein